MSQLSALPAPAPGSLPAPTTATLRKKTLRLYAVGIVIQYALDVLAVGLNGWMLVIRLVMALGLLASAWALDESSEASASLHGALQAGSASLGFAGLLFVSGSRASPYFEFFPFLPLMMALTYPQDSRPAISSGVLSFLGIMGLLVLEGRPLSDVLLWSGITAIVAVMGGYGAGQFRKIQRAESEVRLERARREALEQLAISERRRTQSEKLATLGQLAAGVVHEINNPLAFVQANLAYIEEQARAGVPVSPEELAEVLQETRTGVKRVQQIVADLKGFSHMDAEEPTECALADVVSDATRIASLRLKHVVQVEVEVPAALPPVRAVRRRLAQVLLNLLVNAADALEGRGPPGAWVRITGKQQGSRVLLLVEDNGPGFPPDVLPRLFETFFTTKGPDKGTGLGLALSRELVEQCGGTLLAENREEGGARLRLELPCAVASTPAAA